MKSTAISFRTSAQESVLQILAVITIHRLSNYYGKAAPKTSTPRAIFDKSTLFSAETYRKTHFSAGYSKFFCFICSGNY